MKDLAQEHTAFIEDSKVLLSEVQLLTGYPGWPEMAHILQAKPSIEYVEGPKAANDKTSAEIAKWSEKWNTSWEELHAKYRSLVERSQMLEKRRLALAGRENKFWKVQRERAVKDLLNLLKTYPEERTKVYESLTETEREWERKRQVVQYLYGIGPLGLYEQRYSDKELLELIGER
jgi:hypothetical protein